MVLDIVGVVVTWIAVAVGAWFLGLWMVKVFQGERTFMHPVVRPVERAFYWAMGVREDEEMTWVRYTVSMLVVAFNTAVSFMTNTNWQNYTGEQTMSYLSQMLALVLHNFLSAAVGIAIAVALFRGISSRQMKT